MNESETANEVYVSGTACVVSFVDIEHLLSSRRGLGPLHGYLATIDGPAMPSYQR